MKIKYLCALLLAACICGCDDSTTGIGQGIMPNDDQIPANADSYEFTTQSILSDSVYARTSTAYLGCYTDQQYGEFSSEFLAQFTCPDNFEFDEEIVSIESAQLDLYYSTFFGDSLSPMRMQVDTLNTVIPEKELSTFYTSVNPKDYYDENAKPLAVKAFSALGPSVDSDTTYTSNGVTTRIVRQSVKLPGKLGEYILGKYKEDKNYFQNAEQFINHVLKGVYVRCTHGDGTILYIDDIQLSLLAKKLTLNSAGVRDSVLQRYYRFAATKEVIQANRFQNSDKLKELVADPACSYLKSPAGIFTQAEFPIGSIYQEHKNDTLNGVSITLSCYNDKSNTKYKMPAPKNLLMVRKKEMYSFFENNKLTDGQTAFTCSYNSTSNNYTFSNIAPLVTYCIEERKKEIIAQGGNPENEADIARWEAQNPDWNKVVIIPVDLDEVQASNNTTQVVGIWNSLGLTSAKLKGGKDKLKMQLYYTRF